MLNDQDILGFDLKGVKMIRRERLDELPALTNLFLVALAVLAHLYLLFLLPSLLEISWYYLGFLPIALLLVITNGVIVHEAIHGLTWPSHRGNEFIGRLCGILVGVCFDLQRFDHIQHHVHSSTEKNSPDIKIARDGHVQRIGRLRHWYHCSVGLFFSEFYFNIVTCFRPEGTIRRLRCAPPESTHETSGQIAMRQLLHRNRLPHVRIDGAIILAIHIASLYCFRNHLWLFAGILLGRAAILTTLDSFAHFKTPINARWFAKNIRLPGLIEKWIFMNFNLHGVHHIFPDQSWLKLGELRVSNPMNIHFSYHQGLFGALADKFSLPKYVSEFPRDMRNYDEIADVADRRSCAMADTPPVWPANTTTDGTASRANESTHRVHRT